MEQKAWNVTVRFGLCMCIINSNVQIQHVKKVLVAEFRVTDMTSDGKQLSHCKKHYFLLTFSKVAEWQILKVQIHSWKNII